MTTTFLKVPGKDPSVREKIYQVGNGWQEHIKRFLQSNVGIGSNTHDLVVDSLIILQTSYSVTGKKSLKAGGARLGPSFKKPEV